jgi:hypothetical protein
MKPMVTNITDVLLMVTDITDVLLMLTLKKLQKLMKISENAKKLGWQHCSC